MENLVAFEDLVQGIITERKPKKVNSTTFRAFKATREVMIQKCFIFTVNIELKIYSKYLERIKQNTIQSLPAVCVVSLTKEQLFKGKNRKELLAFFREERFENIHGEILIESRKLRQFLFKSSSFKASFPLHFFFKRLNTTQKREIVKLLILAFNIYSESNSPRKEYKFKTIYDLFEFVVWYVIKEESIHILTTQSTMHLLPVSFRIPNSKFTRKMLWYSTNSQPIMKRNEVGEKLIFNKGLSENVDIHFVWDQDSRIFLESNEISQVRVVGSILFVKHQVVSINRKGFNIVYFDVTPFKNANTYYTENRMTENLCSLVETVEKLSRETREDINLFVKPKREATRIHSREYLGLLRCLERQGQIHSLDPETNLYGLIANADVVLGIPFTSPVIVGREMGISSAFVDMHNDEFVVPTTHNGFLILSNQNLVETWLRKYLQFKTTTV